MFAGLVGVVFSSSFSSSCSRSRSPAAANTEARRRRGPRRNSASFCARNRRPKHNDLPSDGRLQRGRASRPRSIKRAGARATRRLMRRADNRRQQRRQRHGRYHRAARRHRTIHDSRQPAAPNLFRDKLFWRSQSREKLLEFVCRQCRLCRRRRALGGNLVSLVASGARPAQGCLAAGAALRSSSAPAQWRAPEANRRRTTGEHFQESPGNVVAPRRSQPGCEDASRKSYLCAS